LGAVRLSTLGKPTTIWPIAPTPDDDDDDDDDDDGSAAVGGMIGETVLL
jgi:hypothetical protein